MAARDPLPEAPQSQPSDARLLLVSRVDPDAFRVLYERYAVQILSLIHI